MKKNLIFCAYAYKKGAETGKNVSKSSIDTYLQNAIVALVSAKTNNPNCEVSLVTNLEKVPEPYLNIFKMNNISILFNDFNSFNFDKGYSWCLAFYRVCALKYVLTLDYDNFLMIDTDTFTQGSLEDLWQETEHNIMLYYILHRLTTPDCAGFNEEILAFDNIKKPITNYGGEFIAGNKKCFLN